MVPLTVKGYQFHMFLEGLRTVPWLGRSWHNSIRDFFNPCRSKPTTFEFGSQQTTIPKRSPDLPGMLIFITHSAFRIPNRFPPPTKHGKNSIQTGCHRLRGKELVDDLHTRNDLLPRMWNFTAKFSSSKEGERKAMAKNPFFGHNSGVPGFP